MNTIAEALEKAYDELENKEVETPIEEPELVEPIEEPQEEVAEEPEVIEENPVEEVEPAPAALSASAKEKWKDVPKEVRDEWSKRENDIHQMMTRHDGELNLGRKMKDVISPYMPIIQAEGGTPETVVNSLLNTAYQLRTASPMRKAELLHEIARSYDIDLGIVSNIVAEPVNPYIKSLEQKYQNLEQKLEQQNQLQEAQVNDSMMTEIRAFASDPANVYFEQVKPQMAILLDSGQAKSMKEAYETSIWMNPTIRSTLLAKQEADEKAKRKTEIESKKKASVSISGSPAASSNASPKNRSILADLEANWDSLHSGSI